MLFIFEIILPGTRSIFNFFVSTQVYEHLHFWLCLRCSIQDTHINWKLGNQTFTKRKFNAFKASFYVFSPCNISTIRRIHRMKKSNFFSVSFIIESLFPFPFTFMGKLFTFHLQVGVRLRQRKGKEKNVVTFLGMKCLH